MTEHRDVTGWPARPPQPQPQRSRKRWAVAAGVAVCWVVLLAVTGSAITATVVLVVIAGLGVAGVLGLRALGVTRDHPRVQQMADRPWRDGPWDDGPWDDGHRDGQDVLQFALRHLSEVFVVTPSGSLLAPNAIELQLNPDDLRSLREEMEPRLISMSAAEAYEEQVAAHGARFTRPGPADVRVIADPSVPAGRYHLRQGQPVNVNAQPGFQLADSGPEFMDPSPQLAHAGPQAAYAGPTPVHDGPPYWDSEADDGSTRAEPGWTAVNGMPTVMEQSRSPIPMLRLITGDSVTETRMSGARAGRGAVELGLPEVPTVSREHARFTFSDGQWRIANLGMNGLTINGSLVAGEHPLSNGDSIRWGTRPDALLSQVEIS
jgi:hypothetical protein